MSQRKKTYANELLIQDDNYDIRTICPGSEVLKTLLVEYQIGDKVTGEEPW